MVTKVQRQDSIKSMHIVVAKTEQASELTMTSALYCCTINNNVLCNFIVI